MKVSIDISDSIYEGCRYICSEMGVDTSRPCIVIEEVISLLISNMRSNGNIPQYNEDINESNEEVKTSKEIIEEEVRRIKQEEEDEFLRRIMR